MAAVLFGGGDAGAKDSSGHAGPSVSKRAASAESAVRNAKSTLMDALNGTLEATDVGYLSGHPMLKLRPRKGR
jgi:hypothetical protein